jgi:RNA polymerase sigma-70 factor (ECF subfamily)
MVKNIIEDIRLVQGIKKGSVKCFEQLYYKYYTLFNKLIIGIVKDSISAEDITQNIFMKVWIRRESLDDKQGIFSYLYVLAKHEIYKFLKTKYNHGTESLVIGIHDSKQPTKSVEDEYISSEWHDAFLKAVEALPEKRRLVFKLSRFEHRSASDIADLMGLSVRTVEKHLELAVKDLHNNIEKRMS